MGRSAADPAGSQRARLHLLDVGVEEYGDSILCQFGDVSVLVDGGHPGNDEGEGGHPSIPQQIGELLGQVDEPFRIDLLVVTHGHQDHIGCLPALVERSVLQAEWALVTDPQLAWGRSASATVAAPENDANARLIAALREEARSSDTDERILSRFLLDAVTLEQRYTGMLDTLAARGTRVVRHGRDDPHDLLAAFQSIGLQILGPAIEQLLVCAETIARTTQDVIDRVKTLFLTDASITAAEAYRRLIGTRPDALSSFDAASRPGPAVNLQSLVTTFEHQGVKVLLTGDMQFARPEVSDPRILDLLRTLRSSIGENAPYDMVKVAHHGSDNSFTESVFEELGTSRLFGICAGERSSSHPSPSVLRLLEEQTSRIKWARTDRNGLSTFSFANGEEVSGAEGVINDPRPNVVDEAPPELSGGVARPLVVPAPAEPVRSEGEGQRPRPAEEVEVITRLPHRATTVRVSIEVHPGGVTEGADERPGSAVLPRVSIAGGRELPPLLFVTSREALSTNIGREEATRLLESIRHQGLLLFDEVPAPPADSSQAIALVQEHLRRHQEIQGVVLIGGHDVVPALRLDCLPPTLRERIGATEDPDDFIVWSDDPYGDIDGDLVAELPVSRVPDGKTPSLLLAALQSRDSGRPAPRSGIRNVARPFAEEVFAELPGRDPLLVSRPTTFDLQPPPRLNADHVYLMLHGDFSDSSRFWGEDTPNQREALNLTNIPDPAGRVVFTGCCWGALTVNPPASRVVPGVMPSQKDPRRSIAMTFLQRGATAFVGCTGAHYSPVEEPYGYYGGPMHQSFWRHVRGGSSPAKALLEAKVDYIKAWPHGRASPLEHAIEYKILRQYTCLGLGW